MNKTFVLSVVAVFITAMALGFIVHHLLLGQEYARVMQLFRPPAQAQAHFPSDLVAQQVVYDTLASIVLGIVVAAVNRDPLPARA